jgi:ornithine cyclodeaminase/alanine dehydrogenase-like protein (mu-crystallin family)
MPSRITNDDNTHTLGIKVVSVRPNNAEKNIPTVPAVVLMLDEETGVPKALMEASELTCIRTASSSAVATKYLSRQDSETLSVFGCGAQGLAHVISICHVRENIKKVLLWNRTEQRAHDLVRSLVDHADPRWPFHFSEKETQNEKRTIVVSVELDADKAAQAADIICTTTDAKAPLFDGKSVRPGTHVNCIGSYRHDMQEIDSYLVSHSKVVADDKDHVWSESGDLRIPLEEGIITDSHILCNVGEIICGKSVRSDENDITLYKSVGSAFMDVAVGNVVVENALKNNIGQDVVLF